MMMDIIFGDGSYDDDDDDDDDGDDDDHSDDDDDDDDDHYDDDDNADNNNDDHVTQQWVNVVGRFGRYRPGSGVGDGGAGASVGGNTSYTKVFQRDCWPFWSSERSELMLRERLQRRSERKQSKHTPLAIAPETPTTYKPMTQPTYATS